MTNREIKEGDYFIMRAPSGYQFDVFRRVGGLDHLVNSFQTEIHARYFAAARNIANTYGEGPSKTKLPEAPAEMNEAFFRDFFRMPKAEKADESETSIITIECNKSDPLETRAANIVKAIGFTGGGGTFSIPRINPAEATLNAIRVLRKYAELDGRP